MTDATQYLKAAKEPSGEAVTILFEDGSRQVVRPTKAFNGDWRGLCEHLAAGRNYKVKR
jgi:hypothetical protein